TVFNWQGVGAAQFMLTIPVLGLPIAIYGLGSWIWGGISGVYLLALIGLIGLAGTKIWIGLLARWLEKQRYDISSDFRNQ
ncbi:MAG: DUF5687 family protein, partial [Salibacteraceae bacterium]